LNSVRFIVGAAYSSERFGYARFNTEAGRSLDQFEAAAIVFCGTTETACKIGNAPTGSTQQRNGGAASEYFIVGMRADNERVAFSHT
jgi:hypothetical protein